MDINIKIDSASLYPNTEPANRYLPVKLSSTSFGVIGDCIAFLANNADGQFTDITENEQSVLFIVLWSQPFYDEIKQDVLNIDYWSVNQQFQLLDGTVDGISRKIYLDIRAYHKVQAANNNQNRPKKQHIRTIHQFDSFKILYPYIAYVSDNFNSVFRATPIFASENGFRIKNQAILANVSGELLEFYSYNNKCALKGYNDYYDRYEVTNMLGTEYLIYSKTGFNLLRQLYYDTHEYATKEILSEKVVGAITILETPAFETKINSITIFLTTEPINVERATNIDMLCSVSDDNPIKYLRNPKIKTLTFAALHSILKKIDFSVETDSKISYNLLGGWQDFMKDCEMKGKLSDFSSFFSMDKTKAKKQYESMLYDIRHNKDAFSKLEMFIDAHFTSMDSESRRLCALIFPKYKDK